MNKKILWITLIFLPQCKLNLDEAQQKALITTKQFEHAQNIYKSIDYLPNEYTADGCYGRALFVSMELAAEKIPSSAVLVVADSKKGSLEYKGTRWGYHVVPLLIPIVDQKNMRSEKNKIDFMTEVFVLDTAIDAKKAINYYDWYSSIASSSEIIDQVVFLSGSSFVRNTKESAKADITSFPKSFSDFPSFKSEDIETACAIMAKYLGDDEERKSKMLNRTKQLISKLSDLQKFTGSKEIKCSNSIKFVYGNSLNSFKSALCEYTSNEALKKELCL